MSEKARKFLRHDKKLSAIMDIHKNIFLKKRNDYFNILMMSIVYQQLSGAAAGTIYRRFSKICNGRITPKTVKKLKRSEMKKVGLSWQKISYMKDLSESFIKKEINPRKFHFQTDKEVIGELVKVKGIGRWTAEMFLMFSLGREDIFPADDLGIKKAVRNLYKLEDLSSKNLDKFSLRWKPYRSYASLYLWKSVDIKEPKNW